MEMNEHNSSVKGYNAMPGYGRYVIDVIYIVISKYI